MSICRMLFVICVIVTMSLIHVWQQNNITRIGYRVSSLQNERLDLIEENRKLEYKVGTLVSDERISQVIDSFRMGLVLNDESNNINNNDGTVRLYSQLSNTNISDESNNINNNDGTVRQYSQLSNTNISTM